MVCYLKENRLTSSGTIYISGTENKNRVSDIGNLYSYIYTALTEF